MTSKLTREWLQHQISAIEAVGITDSNTLAAFKLALAAMDSEPVELPLDYLQGHKDGLEWAARLAEANHPDTGDWLYDDPIELAKAIRKGPDMPPVQPVADREPVAWLLSGGGAKNVVCFDSGNAYADPLREVTPLYRHAQPAPVVPQDVLDALQKVARIRLDMNDFDGDIRGIADCLGDAEEALIEVVNRRAAMLQAGNSPVIPDSSVIGWLRTDYQQDFQVNCTAPQFVMGPNDPSSAWGVQYMPVTKAGGQQNAPQNIPEIIPGWIAVSERMPEVEGHYLVWVSASRMNGYCDHLAIATYQGREWSNEFNWLVTHWMPLPAAPQEVK